MPLIDNNKYPCVGCGGCVPACPKKCIELVENELGQYRPIVDRKLCVDCGLCEKICPINNDIASLSEVSMRQTSLVGDYVHCYKGYDKDFRKTSASGGLVTSVLSYLLENRFIDEAICVGSSHSSKFEFTYQFVTNPDDLISCSKSAYYPMEISQVINRIKQKERRYAMVVLPCQAKVIRALQDRSRILKERIVYLLGLVCGGVPGKALIEFVAQDSNISVNEISSVVFREKDYKHYNSNYSIKISDKYGNTIVSRMKDDSFGFAFLNKIFNYRGCNFCHDIFAELADVSFMDAWLEDYRRDLVGTSICITRNKELDTILSSYFREKKTISEVCVDIPIRAQNNVGLIQRKKKLNYIKRKFYKLMGYHVDVYNIRLSLKEIVKFYIRTIQEFLIESFSFKFWKLYKLGRISFRKYKTLMVNVIKIVKFI